MAGRAAVASGGRGGGGGGGGTAEFGSPRFAARPPCVCVRVVAPLLHPLLSVPAPVPANRCLWATAIISSFWALEVQPLAVTSLLPLVLYPALGVLPAAAVSTNYFKDKIVLFFGGLVVAAALESVELHRRMALRVLVAFGTKPPQLLLGFMSATAFLSMWMSNTATAAMMMPIAEGVLQQLEAAAAAAAAAPAAPSPAALQRVGKALMLAVAWSANIGGMATLTGTGPNLVLAGDFTDLYPAGPGLSFAHWLAFALPLAVAFLLCAWQLLVRAMLRHSRGLYDTDAAAAAIRAQYAALGPMSFRERLVLGDFAALAVLWITRDPKFIPGWGSLFERGFVSDGTVAALMAILLFALPAEKPRGCRPPARHLVGPTRASDPTLLDGQEPTSTAAVQLEAVPPPDATASAPAADAADAVAALLPKSGRGALAAAARRRRLSSSGRWWRGCCLGVSCCCLAVASPSPMRASPPASRRTSVRASSRCARCRPRSWPCC